MSVEYQELIRLVRRAYSIFPSTRKKAKQALLNKGDDAVDAMVDRLAEVDDTYRYHRWIAYGPLAFILAWLYVSDSMVRHCHGGDPNAPTCLAWICFCGVYMVGMTLWERCTVRRHDIHLLPILCEMRNGYALATLVLALQRHSFRLRESIILALRDILADLTPEVADALPVKVRTALFATIKDIDPVLVFAVLRSLPLFNTGEPCSLVVSILHNKLPASEYEHVKFEAARVYPIIRKFAEQTADASNLLRPSSALMQPNRTLLRAASETGSTSPDELLRAR